MQDILHGFKQHFRTSRLGEIPLYASLFRADALGIVSTASEDDDRQMLIFRDGTNVLQQGNAIHDRHGDIENGEIQLGL